MPENVQGFLSGEMPRRLEDASHRLTAWDRAVLVWQQLVRSEPPGHEQIELWERRAAAWEHLLPTKRLGDLLIVTMAGLLGVFWASAPALGGRFITNLWELGNRPRDSEVLTISVTLLQVALTALTFIAAIGGAAYLEGARGQRATFSRRAESLGSVRVQMQSRGALSDDHRAHVEYLLDGDGALAIARAGRQVGGLTRSQVISSIVESPERLVELERYCGIRAGNALLPDREGRARFELAACEVRARARNIAVVWIVNAIALGSVLLVISQTPDQWLPAISGYLGFAATSRWLSRRWHRATNPLPILYRSHPSATGRQRRQGHRIGNPMPG